MTIMVLTMLFLAFCIVNWINVIEEKDALQNRIKYLENKLNEIPDDDITIPEQLTGNWQNNQN